MAILKDILSYKYEVLNQLLLAATILGGFSMGGAVAFVTPNDCSRLRAFMFDALLLPATRCGVTMSRTDAELSGLLDISDWVVYGIMAGSLALTAALSVSGYVFSRRLGTFIFSLSLLTVILFMVMVWRFAHIVN